MCDQVIPAVMVAFHNPLVMSLQTAHTKFYLLSWLRVAIRGPQ